MFSEKKLKVEITLFATGMTAYEKYLKEYGAAFNIFSNTTTNLISAGLDYIDDFKRGRVLTFEDYKIDADITRCWAVHNMSPMASVKIYGLSKEHMDMITTIAMKTGFITPKRMRIYADDGNGYSLLFEGCILEAVPVYKSAPDIYLKIESSMAAYSNSKSVPPSSFDGNVAISDVCKSVCAAYGENCQTFGLGGIYTNKGIRLGQESLGARLQELCNSYGLITSCINGGYRVFKKGEGTGVNWKFTPDNYVGYPSFTKTNVILQTTELCNIEAGDTFTISGSDVSYANGGWLCNKIHYRLQNRIPNGQWISEIYGTPYSEDL